jgi:hypothetical protein
LRLVGLSSAVLLAALAATTASAAEVRPGERGGAIATRLIALEKDSWQLYKAKDDAALRRFAPADFADVYLDGTVVGRDKWLADMHDVEVLDSELRNFHVFRLTGDAYTVTYEARARGRTATETVETHVGVTSSWVRRGGRWLNLFYEENALEPVRRSPRS